MIEKLTKNKLAEYGFETETIDRLINWNNYITKCHNNKGHFFACNIENKIYSGTDALRKIHFTETYISFPFEDPNLIPEYFELKKSMYLKQQQAITGNIFVEQAVVERFKQIEIEQAKNTIENAKSFRSRGKQNEMLTMYIDWVNSWDEKIENKNKNNDSMIPDKVKSLFEFIDFLDNNKKEYIENYILLVNEVLELCEQRNMLNGDNNYKYKQQYDKIQIVIKEKSAIITNNVCTPIKDKLTTLKIWGGDDTFTSVWNNDANAVRELTTNFSETDIKVIQEYKRKYLSFRTETNTYSLSLQLMFYELDNVLKILFDYFKDADNNEFEQFEKEEVVVNSFSEAVKQLIKDRNVKVVINPSYETNIDETIPSPPQQTETKSEQEKESSNSNKEIYINDLGRKNLIENIKAKFILTEQPLFEQLIDGKKINCKIQFKGKAIDFSRVLSPMLKEKNITTPKLDTINWIVKNFYWTEKDKPKDFNASTLLKHFDSQVL